MQADGGNGHSGKRSPELLFGLGASTADSVRVEVRWRGRNGTPLADTLTLAARRWNAVLLRDSREENR